MASLSNINGIFDVHSTGAILFSTSHGLNGQILRSNGNAAPTWVAASTVIGGPYVPIAGDVTINGYITLAAGKILTVGGNLFVTGTSTLTGALSGSTGAFSGLVSGITPTAAANFATKDYVDNNAGTTYTAGNGITLTGTPATVINADINYISYSGSNNFIVYGAQDGLGTTIPTGSIISYVPSGGTQIVTKAYVSDLPFTNNTGGPFLPLAGGALTGATSITVGTNTTTFSTTANQLIIKNSYHASASGLALRSSNDTHCMQLYGEAAAYGFLASEWGAWNIRKVVSGGLYLNDNNTYFVQPEGTSNMNAAAFAGLVSGITPTAAANFATKAYVDAQPQGDITGLTAGTGITIAAATGPVPTITNSAPNIVQTSVTGNAGTATALQTARTINAVSFNGTANIMVPSIYDGNYRRITNPGGAEYVTTTSSVTGTIEIIMPITSWTGMFSFTVEVYEYITNRSFTLKVGGHLSSTTWYNEFAYLVGNPGTNLAYTIRFGRNAAGKAVVYIGELAETWSYPQAWVTDICWGYSGGGLTLTTGWDINFRTAAFEGVTRTQTAVQVGYQQTGNIANSVVLRDGSGGFSAGAISGTTFNSLPIETSQTNNNVNKIVRTTVNGYVNFGWINSISGNHTGSITRITASDDAYLRYVTPAQFRVGVTDGYYAPATGGSYLPLAGGTVTGVLGLTGIASLGNTAPTRVLMSNGTDVKYNDLATARAQFNLSYDTFRRIAQTTDTNYWTNTMGWGATSFNTTLPNMGSGFFDVWSSPTGQPSTEASHWQGSQAFHYTRRSDSGNYYGYQTAMGSGNPAIMYVRGIWGGTSWGPWYRMHNDATALIKINNQISISTFNERNLKIQGSGTGSDGGITGYAPNGGHIWQLYGSGNDYGFLNGNWAAWDLRKTKSGNLYMNNNNNYYLNTTSNSFLAGNLSVGLVNTSYGIFCSSAISGTNIYANSNGGSFVFGASTSEGEYISRPSGTNDVIVVAGSSERLRVKDTGALEFTSYTATNTSSTPGTGVAPVQNYSPAGGIMSDTTSDLGTMANGDIVRTAQEATFEFTRAEMNALATGNNGGTTLINAPGSNKFVMIEKATFLIYYSYNSTTVSTSQRYEIQQDSDDPNNADLVAFMTGETVNAIVYANGAASAYNYGTYENDTGRSTLNRTYRPNKATTLRRITTSSLATAVTSIRIKLRYRVWEAGTF